MDLESDRGVGRAWGIGQGIDRDRDRDRDRQVRRQTGMRKSLSLGDFK